MLGLRGVRWAADPGLYACRSAPSARRPANRSPGTDPKVEIMVPLVGSVIELHLVRNETEQILADVAAETGSR